LFWYHFTKCFQSGADAATAESELLGVIAEFWSRVAAHARDTQPKPATGFPRPVFFDTFVQFYVFGISHAVHCGMVRVFPKSEATVATDFVRDRICAETYRLIGGYELAPATLRTMSARAFPTPIPIEVRARLNFSSAKACILKFTCHGLCCVFICLQADDSRPAHVVRAHPGTAHGAISLHLDRSAIQRNRHCNIAHLDHAHRLIADGRW
jgi:hypothetical protein